MSFHKTATSLIFALVPGVWCVHAAQPGSAATAAPAQAAPTPPPVVVAPPSVEDPVVTALARKIYAQMRAGKVDESLLTPQMAAGLTPAVLAQQKPVFDQLGDPTAVVLERVETIAAGKRYSYLATFPTAQLHIRLYVTNDGKVGGYFVQP